MMWRGEAEDHVHVVLDEQQRQIVGQAGHRLEDVAAFFLRHAGGRLVEQQHFRLGRERQRDFQQPLAAVGQFARRLIAAVAEPQLAQDVVRLVDRLAVRGELLPELAGDAAPLGDRERHRFERR